jgi:anti-sigma factor RsiW
MNSTVETNETECPRRTIAAYIDGELAASEELALEMHFVGCSICSAELNQQKQILRALDFALDEENEIELPADFTKTIVANAESRVSGLRRPNERLTALFICAALFLLVIVGLGRETETVLVSSGKIVDRTFAVGGFFTHLIYDVAIGTTVILRSLCAQLISGFAFAPAFILFVFAGSVLAFSGLVFRLKRP